MLKSYESWHWRVFNVGRRLTGLMAILNGAIFAIWGGSLLLRPQSTMDVQGMPTAAIGPKLGMMVVGILAVVLGVLLVRVRTYRPDLGDASWFIEPQVARRQLRSGRNWWTGDRKDSSAQAAV
jgi:hypothetical protein